MTLDALIMLLGVLVALVPFLGFPVQWDNALLVVLGVAVIALGIMVRRRYIPRAQVMRDLTTSEEDTPRYGEGDH